MSWRESLTALRTPKIPQLDLGLEIWIGEDADAGYYLFQANKQWIITNVLAPWYIIDGQEFLPVLKPVNGYIYWTNGTLALWYDGAWIISATPGYGTRESWQWNDDDDHDKGGQYIGNAWYSGTLPAIGAESSFAARGCLRGTGKDAFGGIALTASGKFGYWQHSGSGGAAPAGIYQYHGEDNEANRIIGLPQWKDGNGTLYVRSLDKINDKYTYGDIAYDTTVKKWILGTYGDKKGWWDGDEPKTTGSVTFHFRKLEGSDVTGENLTISFDQYVIGDNVETRLMIEAPVWL